MVDDLAAPLVPADVDLRDFPFTPLFRARLFGSSFHARATDAEWRAGVTLWLKSWDQLPAGTLPDDDVDLCRLAELGRDLKAWKKLRTGAMRGWFKCQDGRLHHSVVAEGVLEAWERRSSAKRKGMAGASKRWGTSNGPANATTNAPAIAVAMLGDSKGQGSRQGQEESKQALATDSVAARVNGRRHPANGAGPSRWMDARIVACGLDPAKPPDHPDNLRDRDRPTCNGVFLDYATERLASVVGLEVIPISDKTLLAWLSDGYELDAIIDAIVPVVERAGAGKPLAYFDKPVRERPPTWRPLQAHVGAA